MTLGRRRTGSVRHGAVRVSFVGSEAAQAPLSIGALLGARPCRRGAEPCMPTYGGDCNLLAPRTRSRRLSADGGGTSCPPGRGWPWRSRALRSGGAADRRRSAALSAAGGGGVVESDYRRDRDPGAQELAGGPPLGEPPPEAEHRADHPSGSDAVAVADTRRLVAQLERLGHMWYSIPSPASTGGRVSPASR
jgi:hypothetical protein